MHSNNQSRWSEEYQVTVDELNAGENVNYLIITLYSIH